MQNRQTEYQPNMYLCTHCATVLSEETVGVHPPDAEGNKKLYCTQCNSNQLALVQ